MRQDDILKHKQPRSSAALPLLRARPDESRRGFLWLDSKIVSLEEFAARMSKVARALPSSGPESLQPAMINLCEDRGNFLLAYAAALSVGHTTLLPASRAPTVVSELESTYQRTYRFDDAQAIASLASPDVSVGLADLSVDGEAICMTGFTSGSTGRSKSFPKTWRSVSTSTSWNERAIREALHLPVSGPTPWIVATVPPQHMYGMEFSVLLPMLGGVAVHSGRPLFPADIVAALAEIPSPRILVSTPVHLRVLIESGVEVPPLAGVISATAPLDRELAQQVERRFGTVMFEMFGSTETCIFATRQTAREEAWRLYPEVELTPRPDGAQVNSPWLPEPMLLQDIVELGEEGRFVIRGRNTDFVDVAGKRASLNDLTRRLLDVAGVRDAVVFPPDQANPGQARRVAALVVAPGLEAGTILSRLAESVDPAFLPRPLVLVDRLPRNDTGKLPREQLLACLEKAVGPIGG